MSRPTIMISSTCYDLKQVRSHLGDHISSLGFEPLLSEFESFPIDPDEDTIENCRVKVRLLADIVLLVIGGRYGYVDLDSNKSVTNIEYIEARTKGIPIYAFIDKKVLDAYEKWRSDKALVFPDLVESTRVFEFIQDVRSTDSVWSFPFTTSDDIVLVLDTQIPYLFKISLDVWRKFSGHKQSRLLDLLGPRSLKVLVENGTAWEYRLFFQVWEEQLESISRKLFQYDNNLKIGIAEYVTNEDAFKWIGVRFHEILAYIGGANILVNESAQRAFGPPGVAGNAEEIILTAINLVNIFEIIIDWSLKLRITKADEPFDRVIQEMSKITSGVIEQARLFPYETLKKCEESIPIATEENPITIVATLVFETRNMKKFEEAMQDAKKYFGISH